MSHDESSRSQIVTVPLLARIPFHRRFATPEAATHGAKSVQRA